MRSFFDLCCSDYPLCQCVYTTSTKLTSNAPEAPETPKLPEVSEVMVHTLQVRRHRVDWDTYFMRIAREVATRATCDRKHVGAVIVRDKLILTSGYNGSIAGFEHCDDAGHLMRGDHCQRTVHAEANAIVQAARNGVRVEHATIYVTASPCWPCFKMIANAGIVRVVYGEPYRLDETMVEAAARVKIELVLHQV